MREASGRRAVAGGVLAALLFGVGPGPGFAAAGQEAAARLAFEHTLTGEPLDVTPMPGETVTEAAERFLRTGVNPYNGQPGAREAGARLYETHCAICHGPDASGRMGPNLRDDTWAYQKNRTDKGLFETIYGGAGGLMAGFKDRLSLDEMLEVMAHLRGLRETPAR